MRTTLAIVAVLALVACAPIATNNTTNLTFTGSVIDTNQPPQSTEPETVTPSEQATDFAAHLTFTEGDLIKLKTYAVDPDQDDVSLTFTKPFDKNGVWQTAVGDAGDYPVTVTARDSKGAETTTQILVSIAFANRAPVLDGPSAVNVKEGDTVALAFTASDPDSDETIISYSGWMKSDTYRTTYEDAGSHVVTVTAEDGKLSTKRDVQVVVENVDRAPQIYTDKDVYDLTELETLRIEARAVDPDGDKTTLSFGAPVGADGSWTPQLDQFGDYDIDISATDGTETTVKTVTVHVAKANRAPSVVVPTENGVLTYKEGDIIDLRRDIQIVDPEGEEVAVTYSGWMKTGTYQSGYEDAGTHVVTIRAADDSNHVATKDVTIIVEDVNRPPVFVRPA